MEKIGLQPVPAAIFTGILLSFYVLPHMMLLVCALLVLYATKGVKESIEALSLSYLIGYLNPGIFDFPSGVLMLRWLILFTAFGRVIFTLMFSEKHVLPKPINSLLYFTMICITLTIAASFQPMVSLIKIIMFTIGVFTIMVGFQLTSELKEHWERWFINLYYFVVLASLPFLFTAVGYYNNQAGFQGILNQPQAYGIFLAPFTAYFSARILFQEDTSYVSMLGMMLGWFTIFSTQARMAFAATALSLVFLLIIRMIKGAARQKRPSVFMTFPMLAAMCFSGIILVFYADPIMERFDSFVQKNYEFDEYGEGFQQARGFMIERSMDNFSEYPFMGIGFGVDSRLHDRTQGQDKVMGIPLGAPTEKGFLISAILEEIGIIGMFFFSIFFIALVRYVFRVPLSGKHGLFLACIFVNIAEMVFFSFGGSGLFLWLMIGFTSIGEN